MPHSDLRASLAFPYFPPCSKHGGQILPPLEPLSAPWGASPPPLAARGSPSMRVDTLLSLSPSGRWVCD